MIEFACALQVEQEMEVIRTYIDTPGWTDIDTLYNSLEQRRKGLIVNTVRLTTVPASETNVLS